MVCRVTIVASGSVDWEKNGKREEVRLAKHKNYLVNTHCFLADLEEGKSTFFLLKN